MITSNYTTGSKATWKRPNASVQWYHEAHPTEWNTFTNFFNSDQFDGHFEIQYPDDLTIVGIWYYNASPGFYSIDAPTLDEYYPIINEYYRSHNIELISFEDF